MKISAPLIDPGTEFDAVNVTNTCGRTERRDG
jgi:hypothetical protein